MEAKIIGRKEEIKRLLAWHHDTRSHMVAVYGRRRVGKTYLVKSLFRHDFTFYATGLAHGNLAEQLAAFNMALEKYFSDAGIFDKPQTWLEAFHRLIGCLEKDKSPRKVIFLDELPWMDSRNSRFLAALEYFWNNWASGRHDILLIVCGSATSWMIHKLLNNKRGLYNRVTGRIRLDPFTLAEAWELLQNHGCRYDHYQCVQAYQVFGGIPYYLEQFDPGLSAAQNISHLCFGPNAVFRNEYLLLYRSLFDSAEYYIQIVEAIATKNKGVSRADIVRFTGQADGGSLTRALQELEESGFIRKYPAWGKRSRDAMYQLIDAFSLFHLNFIRDHARDDGQFWLHTVNTPAYNAWAGYAFEMLCLQHLAGIKKALGIEGVLTQTASWNGHGVQIDLVIDRKDHVINIIEIKFSHAPFQITKQYDARLRQKVEAFKTATKTRKAVWLVMLTTFGLAESPYHGAVQKSLTMDILFGE